MDLDERAHQCRFSLIVNRALVHFEHGMIVVEGCNQSPITALYISMRKSSCTGASDDTGGGVTVYVYARWMILRDTITGRFLII